MIETVKRKITSNDDILGCKPIIEGTRVSVQVVLSALGSDMTKEQVAKEYRISIDDVQACLQYASMMVEEEKIHHLH